MFERRVRTVLLGLLVALAVIVARLGDLQILHADYYRGQAAAALLLRPQTLPFVRGRILDRAGRTLAGDEPSWDVKVDYGVLAKDSGYIEARVHRFRKSNRYGKGLTDAQIEAALHSEIEESWRQLAYFSGQTRDELRRKSNAICDRVARIRRAHVRRHGFDEPIEEEGWAHTVIQGLDDQHQIAARRHFESYPWVRIEAANRRVYPGGECLAHVLGRLGAVDAEQIEADPYAEDPFRKYLPTETLGVSGVEHAAEARLRGRRGRFREDRKGKVIDDLCPEPGRDVHLTIRYDLQRRLYDLLGEALATLPHSPGGSIVVLEVPTRDVLALVSFPGYDPNRFSEVYEELKRDAVHMPLRFRAVANRYAPGSIVKPLTCLAGLSNGKITLDTRFDCSGYLFPENPNAGASKCWAIHGTGRRKAHGPVNVVEALTGSCNLFVYRVGMAVGVDYLCTFFDMAGFGNPSGIGLTEETWGINPTPSWLNATLGRSVTRADSRLFAIGQGEVAVSPIQAANLMATYSSGTYKQVRLIQEQDNTLEWQLPVTAEHLLAIRQGLYGVVNSPSGTASRYAHFEHDLYALCGKTGSATAPPRPVSYKITYTNPDGEELFTVLPAGSRREAVDKFEALHPRARFERRNVVVHERYPHRPAERGEHAHAWFAGCIQSIDSAGRPRYEVVPGVAFAVLVEYGGSGGRQSGPVARDVARIIVEMLGDELDPDAPPHPLGPSS